MPARFFRFPHGLSIHLAARKDKKKETRMRLFMLCARCLLLKERGLTKNEKNKTKIELNPCEPRGMFSSATRKLDPLLTAQLVE